MKLTTRGRYAVTAMLDLMLHSQQLHQKELIPVVLADISKRQSISLSYLEQLFSSLKKAELVKSVRGPGGGYLLSREGCDIYICEIIDAVNESVDITLCKGAKDCQNGSSCLTHYLWHNLSMRIRNFLNSISLAELINCNEETLICKR